jgi:hypothetical protein
VRRELKAKQGEERKDVIEIAPPSVWWLRTVTSLW